MEMPDGAAKWAAVLIIVCICGGLLFGFYFGLLYLTRNFHFSDLPDLTTKQSEYAVLLALFLIWCSIPSSITCNCKSDKDEDEDVGN